MLKRYKLVSVVYGGSGSRYAGEFHSLITKRSEEERYPIATKIVMENVLTGDLLNSITSLFTQTEFCVAFLTADDCCCNNGENVYRVRQNVIFELGMAVFRLGRERCILLSDFDPSSANVELPSDLKGIDIKYFTAENREQVFEDVLNKILQLSSIDNDGLVPRYDNLLDRNDYFVNYEDLFASCSNLASNDGNGYLRGVLKYWEAESESFVHYEERCLYFLERVGFLPMFGRHKWVYDWLVEIEKQLGKYKQQDILYCGKKKLTFIRNLAFTVSEFMRMKLQDDYTPEYSHYEDLLNRMLVEPVEESDVSNPLAITVYYDYLGLLYMSMFENDGNPYHLQEAINCFSKILDIYVEHTDMSLGIWSGFVGYNLARCYLKQYKLTGNAEDAKNAQKLFLRASVVRKGWLTGTEFNPAIRSALSYEYFICKIEQISSLKLLGTRSEEAILQEFKRLEGELESYMIHDEQLERLCFVQELLEKRQLSIVEEEALAENLL